MYKLTDTCTFHFVNNHHRTAKTDMATASENARGIGGGDKTAKAVVADQISQAVNSTANLLHLMRQSSSAQTQLAKLPKNLLAKASLTKATGQALAQLPQVISSLDAHIESGLNSGVHLNTVTQLLENMESTQLRSLRQSNLSTVDNDQSPKQS